MKRALAATFAPRGMRWTLALPPLFALAFAALLIWLEQPTYTASTSLMLSRATPATNTPMLVTAASSDARWYGATQSSLAHSYVVAARVVRQAHLPRLTATALLRHSRASARRNADVLDISVSYGGAKTSVRLANLYAIEYIKVAKEREVSPINDAIRALQAKILKLPRRSARAQSLRQQVEQLNVIKRVVGTRASVFEPATSASSTHPHAVRNGFVGSAIGTFIALVLVIGATQRWRPRTRT